MSSWKALAAGLGVVVSEFATANLDLNKEFITVIPEKKISDIAFVWKNRSSRIENTLFSIEKKLESMVCSSIGLKL